MPLTDARKDSYLPWRRQEIPQAVRPELVYIPDYEMIIQRRAALNVNT